MRSFGQQGKHRGEPGSGVVELVLPAQGGQWQVQRMPSYVEAGVVSAGPGVEIDSQSLYWRLEVVGDVQDALRRRRVTQHQRDMRA